MQDITLVLITQITQCTGYILIYLNIFAGLNQVFRTLQKCFCERDYLQGNSEINYFDKCLHIKYRYFFFLRTSTPALGHALTQYGSIRTRCFIAHCDNTLELSALEATPQTCLWDGGDQRFRQLCGENLAFQYSDFFSSSVWRNVRRLLSQLLILTFGQR